MTKENVAHKTVGKGFTLIELLVAILIISILAAVALPQYQKAVVKTRTVQGFVKINALDRAQRAYYLANGIFASDVNNLDIEGIMQNACSSWGSTVYCQIYLPSLIFQWQGDSSGKAMWLCLAKTANETANQLCAAYQKDWGGNSSPEEFENGFTYYYGVWR